MARLRSIEAEIDVSPVVELSARAKKVTVEARVTLRNTGEDDIVVHAASGDDRHFWHVFDANHREVEREKRTAPGRGKVKTEEGVHSFRTETVAAGHETHATRQLTLDAGKLKPGEVYTVRAEFFGHVAETRFSVVEVPTAAARKPSRGKGAKKTSGKRKSAKKRTGRSRKKSRT